MAGRELGEYLVGLYKNSTGENLQWNCEHDIAPHIKQPRSNKAHGYDPLILNLDGKGIQAIAPSSISARFDHNADGIATATGWAAAGNGILALYLDNNGLIDNGRELFGDNTRLANGQNAAHGYAALAELDSNADGIISALDNAFGNLKVWQDLNQDGISQDNELFTLQTLGIKSLNLAHHESNQDLGNGNHLTHMGNYTKTDGSTGEMGDVEFASNSLYSRYTDTVKLTSDQLQAPNLQGIGRLRDLREAAALSPDLAKALQVYAAAQTKEEQTALLNELVTQWGATDPQKSDTSSFKLSSDLILTDNEGIGLTPAQIAAWRNGIVLDAQTTADFAAVRGKIAALDAFTGEKSETLYFGTQEQARQIIDTVNKTYDSLANNIYQGLLFQTRLQPYLSEINFKLDDKQQFALDYNHVQTKFQQVFKDNAQKAFVDLGEFLAFGSTKNWAEGMALLSNFAKQGKDSGQLQDWLSALGTQATAILSAQNGDASDNVLHAAGLLGRDVLNGNDGNDRLIVGTATAIVDGGSGSDTYEFRSGFGATTVYNSDTSDKRHDVVRLHGVGKDAVSYLRSGNDLVIQVAGEQNRITVSNMFSGDILTQHIDAIEYDGGQITLAEIKETLLRGTDNNDFLQGYSDDTVHAGAGNDRIETYNGNDTIYAGSGDDNIDSGGGNDTIYLKTGKNRAYGGDGNDTIVSGDMDDTLEGGIGSDTYVFGKQFGHDTVLNFNPHQQDKDVLKFTHTKLSDVNIHRNENDLVITQKDGQQVTVQSFFEQDGKGDYTVQALEFADGKHLNTDQLREWVISHFTSGDDKLYAYANGNILYGYSGNDTLIGNRGMDSLNSGAGDDTLIGNQGTDYLFGGWGNDTYVFNLGDGHDYLHDHFGNDTLKFGSGIAKQDLWFARSEQDLTVKVLGHDDSIRIRHWFTTSNYHIETIQTADGSHLSAKAVQQLAQAMSCFAPQQGSGVNVTEQMREYAHQVFAANNL